MTLPDRAAVNSADALRGAFLEAMLPRVEQEDVIFVCLNSPPSDGEDEGHWEDRECRTLGDAAELLGHHAEASETYTSLATFISGCGRARAAVTAKNVISADLDDKVVPEAHPGHQHAAIKELARRCPEPFVSLDSGGGVHVHLPLPEGKRLQDQTADEAASTTGGCPNQQAGIRHVEILGIALRRFYEEEGRKLFGAAISLDHTHGVARVWRVPPGVNCKVVGKKRTLTADRAAYRRVELLGSLDVPPADLGFLDPFLAPATAEYERRNRQKVGSHGVWVEAADYTRFFRKEFLAPGQRSDWPLRNGDHSAHDFGIACWLGEHGHPEPVAWGAIQQRRAELPELADQAKGADRFHNYIVPTVEAAYEKVRAKCNRQLPPEETTRAISECFFTPAAGDREAREEPAWIVKPWLVAGSVTCLEGPPKRSGKTILALLMCKAQIHGTAFLGEPAERGPVVYLSEGPREDFEMSLRKVGLSRCADIHCLYCGDVRQHKWPEIAKNAVERCKEIGARCLVVDTWAKWVRPTGNQENEAAFMLEAIRPLMEAADDQRIAVLIVAHTRTTGGQPGEAARGSSALPGAVGTIINMSRHRGRGDKKVRVLKTSGRYSEFLPERMKIKLVGEDGNVEYVCTPRGDDLQEETEEAILRVLPASEAEAMSHKAIHEKLGGEETHSLSTMNRALTKLVEEGDVQRRTRAGTGHAHLYWLSD